MFGVATDGGIAVEIGYGGGVEREATGSARALPEIPHPRLRHLNSEWKMSSSNVLMRCSVIPRYTQPVGDYTGSGEQGADHGIGQQSAASGQDQVVAAQFRQAVRDHPPGSRPAVGVQITEG